MAASAKTIVLICIFLMLGMLFAGVFFQPDVNARAWQIDESELQSNSTHMERLTFLINYAILAPSSHNSQPWLFNVSEDRIRIYADRSRALSVADPDGRELFMSLGCALENLVIAAEHFGYNCSQVSYPSDENESAPSAEIRLTPGSPSQRSSGLFEAITERRTNRAEFEPAMISDSDLIALEESLSGNGAGIRVMITNDSETRERFRELALRADSIQYSNVDYRSELGHWLGQGVMGPVGFRAKLAQMAVVLLDPGPDQIKRDSELINSTPYLGVIYTENNDLNYRKDNNDKDDSNGSLQALLAGRAFERLWLTATSKGLSLHPMSQAIEVPETRALLSELVPVSSGAGAHVMQTFRLGYAKELPEHSNRRPLSDVLI